MDRKIILLISVVCLLVPVQFSESKSRRKTTIRSGYCNLITSGRCLMKIGAGSASKRRVSIDGAFTTDLATRFTIVKIKDSSGKTRGKCIEFTTSSQVKYALKVVNPNNIVFEKKPKGCDYTNISDNFIFKESRHYRNHFTYTYNSKCLAAKTDGTLFLKTIKDQTIEVWPCEKSSYTSALSNIILDIKREESDHAKYYPIPIALSN